MRWIPDTDAFSIILKNSMENEPDYVLDVFPNRWQSEQPLEFSIATYLLRYINRTTNFSEKLFYWRRTIDQSLQDFQHTNFIVRAGGALYHQDTPLITQRVIHLENQKIHYPDGTIVSFPFGQLGQTYAEKMNKATFASLQRKLLTPHNGPDISPDKQIEKALTSALIGMVQACGEDGIKAEITNDATYSSFLIDWVFCEFIKAWKSPESLDQKIENIYQDHIQNIKDLTEETFSSWILQPDISWNPTRFVLDQQFSTLQNLAANHPLYQAGYTAMQTALRLGMNSGYTQEAASAHAQIEVEFILQESTQAGIAVLRQKPFDIAF